LPNDVPLPEVLRHQAVREHVRLGLAALHGLGGGSSTYAQRALLMSEPLSVDAGEITDKGYINQGAVLRNRARLVDRLYAAPVDSEVITF
jgi:feruloyl-CoA synthase